MLRSIREDRSTYPHKNASSEMSSQPVPASAPKRFLSSPLPLQYSDALIPTPTEALSRDVKKQALKSGCYMLSKHTINAFFLLVRGALAHVQGVNELIEYAMKVPSTERDDRFAKPGQLLGRKEASFLPQGFEYSFSGKSRNNNLDGPWPELVKIALEDAKSRLLPEYSEMLNLVVLNYYPLGKDGIGRHADDEKELVAGFPIFSYTWYETPELARRMQVYHTLGGKGDCVANILLGHGDVLIMAGDMQDHYQHGVNAIYSKKFSSAVKPGRVNLTIRAYQTRKESEGGAAKRPKLIT